MSLWETYRKLLDEHGRPATFVRESRGAPDPDDPEDPAKTVDITFSVPVVAFLNRARNAPLAETLHTGAAEDWSTLFLDHHDLNDGQTSGRQVLVREEEDPQNPGETIPVTYTSRFHGALGAPQEHDRVKIDGGFVHIRSVYQLWDATVVAGYRCSVSG